MRLKKAQMVEKPYCLRSAGGEGAVNILYTPTDKPRRALSVIHTGGSRSKTGFAEISQWHDDKGFGFIKPDTGSDKIFFHISSVKSDSRRPQIGDTVLFDSIRDSQQRLKAKSVVIEGGAKSANSSRKQKFVPIEPPKKDLLDYTLMLVCFASLAAATIDFFYRSGEIVYSLLYAIPAVVAFPLLARQKMPKDKSFTCSGCKKIANHDQRTIEAWNRGFTKIYCKTCHLEWLRNNPNQDHLSLRSKKSGCLGTVVLMIIIPAVSGILLYNWLA